MKNETIDVYSGSGAYYLGREAARNGEPENLNPYKQQLFNL